MGQPRHTMLREAVGLLRPFWPAITFANCMGSVGGDSPPFVKRDHGPGLVIFAGRFGLKRVRVWSMAQATASRRSATERRARP